MEKERENMEKENEFKKVECPQCGGHKVRTRVKSNERVCERCGYVWKGDFVKENNEWTTY